MTTAHALALWAWDRAPLARPVIPLLWRPWGNRRTRRAAADLGRDGGVVRLHLGAARQRLAGWLDTDVSPEAPFYLDATQAFPFPDGSVAAIFTENLIEHMELRSVPAMLRECHRTLVPGGVLRIATPDLEAYAGGYVHRTPQAQALVERNRRYGYDFGPGIAALLNKIVYADGHRYCFDFETLSILLRDAGFAGTRRQRVGESDRPELRGLERHDVDTVLDDFVLVVEAQRG